MRDSISGEEGCLSVISWRPTSHSCSDLLHLAFISSCSALCFCCSLSTVCKSLAEMPALHICCFSTSQDSSSSWSCRNWKKLRASSSRTRRALLLSTRLLYAEVSWSSRCCSSRTSWWPLLINCCAWHPSRCCISTSEVTCSSARFCFCNRSSTPSRCEPTSSDWKFSCSSAMVAMIVSASRSMAISTHSIVRFVLCLSNSCSSSCQHWRTSSLRCVTRSFP